MLYTANKCVILLFLNTFFFSPYTKLSRSYINIIDSLSHPLFNGGFQDRTGAL